MDPSLREAIVNAALDGAAVKDMFELFYDLAGARSRYVCPTRRLPEEYVRTRRDMWCEKFGTTKKQVDYGL